ncbi:MAG TPA: hypothetical protein VHW04_17390 [Solirubrobacteraceae bacterium]|jgi:hypothetical protein|nr:hypothetical protein [Solirubrobacteraceae bacterium]
MATATQAPPVVAGTRTYDCPECDHELRVFGRGRHRMHFALIDEHLDGPVMDSACPESGHALPGKTGTSAS